MLLKVEEMINHLVLDIAEKTGTLHHNIAYTEVWGVG